MTDHPTKAAAPPGPAAPVIPWEALTSPDATPRPWTTYRCQFEEGDRHKGNARMCGLNGQTVDASYDECHHTLSEADALLIVAAVNAFAALDATVIARIRACGGLAAYVADLEGRVALAEGERDAATQGGFYWKEFSKRLQAELAAQREVMEGLIATCEQLIEANRADTWGASRRLREAARQAVREARDALATPRGGAHPGEVAGDAGRAGATPPGRAAGGPAAPPDPEIRAVTREEP